LDCSGKENFALQLIEQGRLYEAEKIYQELLGLGLKNDVIFGNLAVVLGMQGRFEEAAFYLEESLSLNPVNANAHNNLGLVRQNQGNFVSAINSYQKSLSVRPLDPEVLSNLGSVYREIGDYSAAIVCYKKALSIDNRYTDALYNLGIVFKHDGKINAAIECYKKTISLNPDHPKAYNNLGVILKDSGELEEAIICYEHALRVNFSDPINHFNMGNALKEKGDLKNAAKYFKQAFHLKPDYSEAHFNFSLAELSRGNYSIGWKHYNYSFESVDCKGILTALPASKRWDGDDVLRAQKLLLVGEQGLGDILQFMRYVIALTSQKVDVLLCAPLRLHSLIKASGINEYPLTPEEAQHIHDRHWLPLLSLPRYLDVNPSNPILTNPYIKTTDALISKWRDILSAEQKPIIGINWQGNPAPEASQLKGRSLPLQAFLPISLQTTVSLLSLQKGFGSEQLQTCSFRDSFVKCQDVVSDTWDFLETAAIIYNCDLIITSDTSVAHLSAGMGKQTWLLLQKFPEWRWTHAGEKSFWYPSMRLFRQQEHGCWDEVIVRVAEVLRKEFLSSTPSKT